MKHNIRLEGYAYSLRPVELADAEFIVEVRTPERSRFMHRIERTVQAQREWLENYFQRPNEYYFLIERMQDHSREGLTSLLDFDEKHESAQWGRLILRPGSLGAAETALFVLKLAFDTFGLNEVWGPVLAGNAPMIAYVKSLGFECRETVSVPVDGKMVEGIRAVLARDRWSSFEEKVTETARQIALRLQSGR
jgi:RimJ/RimL family protein N-acetyltransferase